MALLDEVGVGFEVSDAQTWLSVTLSSCCLPNQMWISQLPQHHVCCTLPCRHDDNGLNLWTPIKYFSFLSVAWSWLLFTVIETFTEPGYQIKKSQCQVWDTAFQAIIQWGLVEYTPENHRLLLFLAPEIDSKTLLLNTLHTWLIGHEKKRNSY